MRRIPTRCLMPALLLLCCADVSSQEAVVPVVTSTGKATAYTTPTHVVFRLVRAVEGESLDAAMIVAKAFEEQLPKQVAAEDLHPTDIHVYAPVIAEMSEKKLVVVAELVFSTASFANLESGPRLFAGFCDKMAALAEQVGCDLEGPAFESSRSAATESEAVAQATENAYPAAEAAAGALNSAVYSVDKVEVVAVSWTPEENDKTTPSLRRIGCRAEVRVTYALDMRL